jgi:hypothetical protein
MVSDYFAAPMSMPVIEFDAPASLMSVVDAINSFSSLVVKREAVFDPAWSVFRACDSARFVLDDVAFGEIEFLSVQAQERFHLEVRSVSHPWVRLLFSIIHPIMM